MTNRSLKALAILTCLAFLSGTGSLSSARAQYAEPPPAKGAPKAPPPNAPPPNAPPSKADDATPPKYPPPPPPEYRQRDEDVNSQIWHMRTERDNIRKGGPIAGVVLSTIFLTAGISMMAQGGDLLNGPNDPAFSDNSNCDVGDNWSCHEQGRALLIGGAIITAGTTVGLAFSARNLRHRKQRIRELDRNIRDLEYERYRTSVSYGAPQKPALLRF